MQTSLISELESLQPTTLDAGQVFSGKSSGRLIQGYAAPTAYTPAINPDYIFHESSRDIIVWLMQSTEPLYVYGSVGCGKTTSIKQLAARLNYPVFEVTGHGRLEFADLVGHLVVKEGSMTYEYGPLALAMRYGGLCVVNEIDLTPPEVAAGLNTVLDGSPLCVAENGGELITPHPMFRFAATANTNGGGDETGLYQGTQRQNLAWLDRFVLCEMGYPAPGVEKALLVRRYPVLPDVVCSKMVEFAGEVRKLFMGASDSNLTGAIEVTLSTRTLLRWADLTVQFQPLAHQGIQPVRYALDRALGFRASRETRAMLHELAQRIFPQHEDLTCLRSTSIANDVEYLQSTLQRLLGCTDLARYARLPDLHLNKATDNKAGGKFWRCTVATDGLDITWGQWKTAGQSLRIERPQCAGNDPAQELLNRAQKKIREGYGIDRITTFIPMEN